MHSRRNCSAVDARAFSLIEVVAALAVFTFAFVGLLGLIPTSLSSLSTAIDSTVESQIMQHISTMARQANFSALKNDQLNLYPGPDDHFPNREKADYFFDEQGEPIVDPARQQRDYAYAASVLISKAGTSFPTAAAISQSSPANSQIVTVRVGITKRSDPSRLRSFSFIVANNGLGP